MTRRLRPVARHVTAVVLLVMAASACAGIPTSGPVTKVEDDAGLGESTVRYSPARPIESATPEQVVRGFLDAMLAFPASSRTASAFLTPAAAKEWNPSTRTAIYSTPEVSGREPSTTGLNDPRGVTKKGAVDVRLDFEQEAVLDQQGHYTRRGGTGSVTYTLEQVDREWRISNPQDGSLVNLKFFTDYFRPFDLFYFDRPGRRLVADPVHLVVGDQLATNLVTSLVRGPGPGLETSARTYAPPLDELRPSVPVSDERVADVEFTRDLGGLSRSERDHLSAQVVWTLRQVPDVDAVQVIGGTTALTSGGLEVQPVSSWGGYGPTRSRGRAYAVSDGRAVQVDDGKVTALSGSWGRDARGAVLLGVSEAGVAGVLGGRTEVRLTNRKGGEARTIRGSGFVAPEWDAGGTLWLVDRGASGPRVRVVAGRRVRAVSAGALRGETVERFAVSPDGTRYAVTTGDDGGRIVVGTVLRDGKDRILGLGRARRVLTTAERPRSASWSSATRLGFLAESAAGVQVYEAAIDGSRTSDDLAGGALLPDVGAGTLAIGPGQAPALYATDERDRLWYRAGDGAWRQLKAPGVTGLTVGR